MRCSETDRALICPASLVLPRQRTAPANDKYRTDEANEWGTICHAWVETGETEDRTLNRKILLSGIDRDFWWPPGEHEVSYALNVHSLELARYVGDRELANEWKAQFYDRPEMLTGTIDYRGRHKGRPWIDDLKTGRWPVPYTKKQLLSYHLFGWVEEGCPADGRLYYRSITQWQKYPLDGLPTRSGLSHPVTGFDLACHLEDVRWAVDHPGEVNPEPIYVGPWDPDIPLSNCAFCPSRVEFPRVAPWMNNFRYRATEHCPQGMLKRIADDQD